MSMTASLGRAGAARWIGSVDVVLVRLRRPRPRTLRRSARRADGMSSLYADTTGPGSVAAAKMAVEEFLAAPHKIKRPIEVISADHMNKADAGANIAREWLDRSGVDAIIDTPNSAVALAVRNVVEQKNRALLMSGASSSDLTGKSCSPNLVHWTYDTYALSTGVATRCGRVRRQELVYADRRLRIRSCHGTGCQERRPEAGRQRRRRRSHADQHQDFSSFLFQAQASKSQVIALINAGGDTINSIKQSVEFGIPAGGQRVVAMVLYLSDVHSLGLKMAQGLQFTESFYWDLNDRTRDFTKRFAPRNNGRYPSALQAGVYGEGLHYLKAVDALGSSNDGKAAVDR